MTRNQQTMRSIARGSGSRVPADMTAANRKRYLRDPAGMRARWAAADERRRDNHARNRAERIKREEAEAERIRKLRGGQ